MTARRYRQRENMPPGFGPRASERFFAAARAAALVAALAMLLGAVAALAGPEARAQDGERFVSLKAERANLRVGPGRRYPIEWVYTRPGLPLLVIAHFDQWRWVRDHEGTKGWMHKSLLSTHRTALIMGRGADHAGAPVERLAGGPAGRGRRHRRSARLRGRLVPHPRSPARRDGCPRTPSGACEPPAP